MISWVACFATGEREQCVPIIATASDFWDGVYNGFAVYNNRVYFNYTNNAFVKYGIVSLCIGCIGFGAFIIQIQYGFVGAMLFLLFVLVPAWLYSMAFGRTLRVVFDMTLGTISFGRGAKNAVDAFACPPGFSKYELNVKSISSYILSLSAGEKKSMLIAKNIYDTSTTDADNIYDFLINLIETSLKTKTTVYETGKVIIAQKPELRETLRYASPGLIHRLFMSCLALVGYFVFFTSAVVTLKLLLLTK